MNKKYTPIILIIYIVTIVIIISGVTYAYFTNILVSNSIPEVEIKSAETEFIVFNVGSDINLIADENNMLLGLNSVQADTLATASLKLSEGQKKVTHKYNIYLEIEENEFGYSTPDKKPELLLDVFGPDGELLEMEKLDFVQVKDNIGKWNTGFDITTKKGRFYIVKDYEISADSLEEVMHKWLIRVTFINLEDLQNDNTGKNLKGHIKIEKADD